MVEMGNHKRRNKLNRMGDAEIMANLILFHSGGFRCFKHYYKEYAYKHLTHLPPPLRVCRNQRILMHKTFKGFAERGKCPMGWFFGFKLHLIINDKGGILNFMFTPGNVDDREPLIETVNDGLKNIAQIEHSRHNSLLPIRSPP